MDKEMLAMVTFKEGMFDKFMGWFQSEEGLEIRKTIANVEQTRPGFAPDKSYAMMKVTVYNEENMKQFASGNHPNPNAKAMFDDCVDNVQLWDLSKTEV